MDKEFEKRLSSILISHSVDKYVGLEANTLARAIIKNIDNLKELVKIIDNYNFSNQPPPDLDALNEWLSEQTDV